MPPAERVGRGRGALAQCCRDSREKGSPAPVRGLISKENLLVRLVLGSRRMRGSLHLPGSILEVYIEALAESVTHTRRCSQSHVTLPRLCPRGSLWGQGRQAEPTFLGHRRGWGASNARSCSGVNRHHTCVMAFPNALPL